MKNQTILIFLFCSGCVSLVAQSGWTNYNSSNGMFSNSAMVVEADKFNIIWVGIGSGSNGDGLEKFDGTAWTHFDTVNSGLPQNDIRCLRADTSGNLWMSYFGGLGTLNGLTKFDGNTSWIVYDTNNSAIPRHFIYDIQVDDQNHIWLSCIDSMSRFDGVSFTNYPAPAGGRFVIQDSANIWLGAHGYGLFHFNPLTGIWTLYDQNNSNIPSSALTSIDMDSNGKLWLGFGWPFNAGAPGITYGGLSTFNGSTFSTIWPFQNTYTGVYSLKIDTSNNVWVSASGEGLYKYDGTNWTIIAGVPPTGVSYSVGIDRQNYVWYAEVYSGVWTNRLTVDVHDQQKKANPTVWPNPASESFTIQHNFTGNETVVLKNSVGQEVLRQEVRNKSDQLEIDTREITPGIYFWSLLANEQSLSAGKIVVTK
ncbi:MAG TPA: T9SS type A sorting domain-containing protein [Bacteroidia bacterium]|nr:T9SS type A sorting domain-containing protein [Bacteroidia bacterium]